MSLNLESAESKNAVIELRRYRLRNTTDAMVQRTNDYIGKALIPALQRGGFGPVGAFMSLIAPDGPFVLLVTQFANIAAWEGHQQKLAGDAELTKAREGYYAGALQYTRIESSLLRGFPTMPGIEVPKPLADGKTRVFELRTYESNTPRTLARKVKMFDDGEIGLFRKLGMAPVFFGETIVGANMPNLTYMLAFDDLASREKAWNAFGSSPEWAKMKSQPGLSDPEIVSNISNTMLRPMGTSQIR